MPAPTDKTPSTAVTEARVALVASGCVLLAYAACARLPLGGGVAATLREALGAALVGVPLARGHLVFGTAVGRRSMRDATVLAGLVLPLWLLVRAWALHAWHVVPTWHGMGTEAGPPLLAALRAAWVHVVAVALPEEMFWRGYVQPALQAAWPAQRRVAGAPLGRAAALSCALFAASHVAGGGGIVTLATFLPGLLFAWLQARHGAVSGPWLLHATCNLVSLAADACLPGVSPSPRPWYR